MKAFLSYIDPGLLSEEGYYPFGLTMSAISSSAGTVAKNNYKFNDGTELTESFDINYYETYFRQYDAQLGRFTGVDALAEQPCHGRLINLDIITRRCLMIRKVLAYWYMVV